MSDKPKTLVVNLLGGPGCGKSTTAAHIFAELKWKGIDCELASEYAKELVWEKRYKTFENQIYLFGKQHYRIYRLLGQVEVVITDSPLILTPIYDLERRESLKQLVLHEYNKVDNFNIFLTRRKQYVSNGRNHTEEEAKGVDRQILTFLKDNSLDYTTLDGDKDTIELMVRSIQNWMAINYHGATKLVA